MVSIWGREAVYPEQFENRNIVIRPAVSKQLLFLVLG